MSRLLLCLLLILGCVNGLSTLTYSFPAQATSSYQRPSYSLGYLYANTAIVISIVLPDNSGYDLSPSNFYIAITDSANQATIQTFSCSASNSCRLQWTVATQGSYFLQIYAASASIETAFLVRYNVFVTANGTQITRTSDVLRQHIIKYFYLGAPSPVTITQWPSDSANNYPTILQMGSNKFAVASTSTPPASSTNGQSKSYVVSLAAGYFAIIVNTDVTLSVSITFQSDQYNCPYSSDYPDFYSVFQGCVSAGTANVSPGLPCLNFDYGSNRCLNCMSGYSVGSNGGCQLATSCGPRQYSHFGACSDVSPTCGSFDAFTGDCLNCINTSYQLAFGKCVLSYSQCRDDQNQVGTLCVSKYCGKYDAMNGGCITCASAAYYLNGVQCLPIFCGDGSYFSLAANGCRLTPVGCYNFSTSTQSCSSCMLGYILSAGVCMGQGSNCDSFDYNRICIRCSTGYYMTNQSLCLSIPVCQNGQYLVNNVCSNTAPPISAIFCPPGQIAVNGACTTLVANCKNMVTQYACSECLQGYNLLRGICVPCNGPNPAFPCTSCSYDKYVDSTGRCVYPSPFCSTFSQASGWCLTCISGNSPINGICCDSGSTLIAGLCTPNTSSTPAPPPSPPKTGSIKDRFPRCLIYNPQLDICTQCYNRLPPTSAGC